MEKGNESSNHFDYIIIGSGLAGLHLAMAITADNFFKNKRIAILDKSSKDSNDKTYCFWEKTDSNWNNCISKSWQNTYFKNNAYSELLNLKPYLYKKINAIDFYNYCKKALSENTSLFFFNEEVTNITEDSKKASISTKKKRYTCTHAFDSRIGASLATIKKESTYINQSFRGWSIETKKPVFNSEYFTMMDYNLQWKDSSSFMYILPQSSTEALFEYTLFTPSTISDNDFDSQIKKYIDTYYPNIEYTIKTIEKGSIPMTNYKFEKHNTKRVTKIGTAGGWVKPTTGYSFKFAEKNSLAITKQLKEKKPPFGYRKAWRFKFYDKLFLRILANKNSLGPSLFTEMYQKTKPNLLFRFLDEETSLIDDINFIRKLTPWPFLMAIFKK